MSTVSPPKPWEISRGATSAASNLGAPTNANSTTVDATSSSSNAPPLPSIPSALSTVATRNATINSTVPNRYSPYQSAYGGGYNNYGSPYSSFGGGYGSMGSMYGGGYGGMYGSMGMGGMYGGMGMPGDPNNPHSLTQSFSQSTAATFQLIENMVGAFGGFAQMLQSTYMATHSSFFAMVSVAEQFGNLRQTLGSVLGIYTLLGWLRKAYAKLTGRAPPARSSELSAANFAAFTGRNVDGSPAAAKPSKKPLVVFLMAAFGLPYLMGKLIKLMAHSQEEEERRRMAENSQAYGQPVDPSKLEFCRALYDFTPDAQMQGMDLSIKKGDAVAVLSKTDPLGNASEWWHCRSRDGRMGYLPGIYLETIIRKPAAITAGSTSGGSAPGSRTQTMTSTSAGGRAQTMTSDITATRTSTMADNKVSDKAPKVDSKAGDVAVSSFQKGAFYS